MVGGDAVGMRTRVGLGSERNMIVFDEVYVFTEIVVGLRVAELCSGVV